MPLEQLSAQLPHLKQCNLLLRVTWPVTQAMVQVVTPSVQPPVTQSLTR